MSRRRNVSITKTLKDYIVPIIGLLLIVLLIFSVFSGNDNSDITNKIQNENQVPLEVKTDNDFTQAYVVYAGENKKLIEGQVSLYKGEKILVKQGNVLIDFLSVGSFVLSELGELRYNENGQLFLESGKLWINSESKLDVSMKYANMTIGANSHLSLSQNEMSSTVHLLSGDVEVRNMVGKSTILAPGQKINIERLNSNNEDIDLTILKENLDDFFKKTDWYIKNNGDFYLSSVSELNITQTGSQLEAINKKSQLIVFDSLTDESYVSDSSIDITGKYFDENIVKIKLNDSEAKLDSETKTFTFNSVDVSSQENDLVFKILDDSNDILQKFIYLVYYKGGSENNSSSSVFNVKTYSVDGSQFTFTAPSTSGTFTTTTDFVTIRGKVLAEGISNVSVNGYTLSSFNGSTWRYHADMARNNLKDGTNVYNIKYFDKAGTVVYTNNYSIIRKPVVETPAIPEEKIGTEKEPISEKKTYSDEVL